MWRYITLARCAVIHAGDESKVHLYSVFKRLRMDFNMRIGNGYDIHRLVLGKPLIIGGVKLDHEMGLEGLTDADVLTHAIIDALLGALSLGDIGHHFPPSDPKWKGANSLMLLQQVMGMVQQRGWKVVNIDSVVVAERPRLMPHIGTTKLKLAPVLGVDADRVGVKAKTNEGLGPIGREEGIAAHALALLTRS